MPASAHAHAPSGEVKLLEQDRALLDRTSTADRVAGILRRRISDGDFAPGTQLSEETITAALRVSRNTLREAFRLLSHERLLVHELNRGVFVRVVTPADVVDLYRVRKLIECAVIRDLAVPLPSLERLAACLAEGDQARARSRRQELGTANTRFHQALVALAGSPRLDAVIEGILAELRLVFSAVPDQLRFHERYLSGNRVTLRLLQDGNLAGAEHHLRAYLDDAERETISAHTERGAPEQHPS